MKSKDSIKWDKGTDLHWEHFVSWIRLMSKQRITSNNFGVSARSKCIHPDDLLWKPINAAVDTDTKWLQVVIGVKVPNIIGPFSQNSFGDGPTPLRSSSFGIKRTSSFLTCNPFSVHIHLYPWSDVFICSEMKAITQSKLVYPLHWNGLQRLQNLF